MIELLKSNKADKKYMVKIISKKTGRERTIHFGASGMSDYTIHKDEARKQRYIDRHKANENWNNPETAGYWALKILWSYPTIEEAWRKTKIDLKNKGYIK